MIASAMERGLCPKTVEEIEILGLPLSDTVISDFLPPQSKSSDFIQYLPSFLRPLAAKSPHLYLKFAPANVLAAVNVLKVVLNIPLKSSIKKLILYMTIVFAAIAVTKCVRNTL